MVDLDKTIDTGFDIGSFVSEYQQIYAFLLMKCYRKEFGSNDMQEIVDAIASALSGLSSTVETIRQYLKERDNV